MMHYLHVMLNVTTAPTEMPIIINYGHNYQNKVE